jgi:hypothetical protein
MSLRYAECRGANSNFFSLIYLPCQIDINFATQGWYSKNFLQTSYDHYLGRGALSERGLGHFKLTFCS